MLNTLTTIGNKLSNTGIIWGVGGSMLLSFHGLIDNPNDIDLLVSEKHKNKINRSLAPLGETVNPIHAEPFRTSYFSKLSINNTDIDIMGGFAIQHDEGVYRLSLREESIVAHKQVNGVDIPLCSLEDWYILYSLIPGKQEKAALIEQYLKTSGVHTNLLKSALKQPLPSEVEDRVIQLLN